MNHTEDPSEFVEHVPCENENCGSSDANSLYSDGHQFCFACENYVHPPSEGEQPANRRGESKRRRSNMGTGPLIPDDEIEIRPMQPRGLNLKTVERWNYGYSRVGGQKVHVASYCNDMGHTVAQKLRFPDKDMPWVGDKKAIAPLYGMWLWPGSSKRVIITEGEIDAMTVSQIQDHKWPVVSLTDGAPSARKCLSKALKWLDRFDEIVLFFDNDDPGREAIEDCIHLFEPGRIKIARASDGCKDANEMLMGGFEESIMRCVWGAEPYRPANILSVDDVRARAKQPIEWGVPWPWETLTKLTYGRRTKRIYMFGAGVGVGKTDVFTQIIAQTISDLKEACATIYLEQAPEETLLRVAGKMSCKLFHVPDAGWDQTELDASIDSIPNDLMYLYDHWGSTAWEDIKLHVRHLVVAEGVKHVFLDHLTALIAHADDERRALDAIMAEMASLAQELDFTWYVVSHLTTPDGKPHEEGGRVMEKHFTGSRAIARWSHFMFGLERNKQAEDVVERSTTTFRVLKDRDTGSASGETFGIRYDKDTGVLEECSLDFDEFKDAFGDGGDQPKAEDF